MPSRRSSLRLRPRAGSRARTRSTRTAGWAKRYSIATTSAISFLTQATQLQPDNALAWYLLGSFRLAEGCPYAALPAFSKATVFDGKKPAYAEAYQATLATGELRQGEVLSASA